MPSLKTRVAVVGLPGSWSSEALADALATRTGFRLLIDPTEIVVDLDRGRALVREVDLVELDAIVIKKAGQVYTPDMLDRLELLRFVAERGVRVFSHPSKMLRLLDRLSCTITLRAGGIPMPPTVVTEDVTRAAEAIEAFGAAVLKPLYSTKARGMVVLEAGDLDGNRERIASFRAAGNPMVYLQQRIDLPDRDLGVVFLGGRYLATYARVRQGGSWNTTIHDGGRYAPHEPRPETLEVAARAQALFGLDFTSVDVVETAAGPVVFEVSTFGGFRGLTDGLGIDAAGRYADHVLAELVS